MTYHVPLLTPGWRADVPVPGSKSIANRALICAALADGTSTLTNVPDGDDTNAMTSCLSTLGVLFSQTDGQTHVCGRGAGPGTDTGPVKVHAGLAGTTSRFITAFAALYGAPVTIDGFDPLRARPFAPLHDALRQLGATVSYLAENTQLPVVVTGPLSGATVTIGGDVSSQFVSALMLIGPYLPGGLTISLSSALVSAPYVEITRSVMASFGMCDVQVDTTKITVGEGVYQPTSFAVEPDASSASYPLALAALTGGDATIPGLGTSSVQGDAAFAGILERMGVQVDIGIDHTRVVAVSNPLRGLDLDMSDISDLVPTMAVVACAADEPSVIRGVGFIRDKESDRLGDLATEMQSAGFDVQETDDGLEITPSAHAPRAATLATHHDHRLAMAFGVLGARWGGIRVATPEVVTKSWPDFWLMCERLDQQRN